MVAWHGCDCRVGLVEIYCYETHQVFRERHTYRPGLGVCLPEARWEVDTTPHP